MRRILATVLILCVMGLLPAGALSEDFRVGMECDYAPFNWTQSDASETGVPIESGGFADGYDVQIAVRIAEGLNRNLVIVKTDWDGLPLAVMSGQIDAIIAGMSPTAERSVTIDFSDAYYTSDLVIVVRADSPYAGAAALQDFAGANITGQLNTFHYSVIDQIEGVNRQNAMETFPAMIIALMAGTIDGYISERPGAVSAMAAYPELTFISFAENEGFQASPEDVAIAVGLIKGSDLREPINSILSEISYEQRVVMMDEAVSRQPLGED